LNKTIYALITVLLVLGFTFTYFVKDYSFNISIDGSKEEILRIIPKPIKFDSQRKFLTALYREKHTSDCNYNKYGVATCIVIDPKIVVVHMTGKETLEESFLYMNEPVLREERDNLLKRSYDRVNVSAHFLIDKDGTIYTLMPETYMARHAMGVNHLSIGIENVGVNHTNEQVVSNVKLLKYLFKKYKIEEIYSHSDISKLRDNGSKYYVENDENYFRHKDCGAKLLFDINKELDKWKKM
jgi:N-acetylmuramoyl-L-alanine amidase